MTSPKELKQDLKQAVFKSIGTTRELTSYESDIISKAIDDLDLDEESYLTFLVFTTFRLDDWLESIGINPYSLYRKKDPPWYVDRSTID
jgi:hypothetical protein